MFPTLIAFMQSATFPAESLRCASADVLPKAQSTS
jgi:hypothetical protein